jgi:phage gp36-like protein
MSQFVQLSDYDATIHREILDALTRTDESVIEICEDRAIAEMRCYLSKRYDCDRIFSATEDKRLQLVLMMVIDIAVYHIFCIHNPQKLSQLRKDRYERAVEWMKAVAAEDISIEGAPLLPEDVRAAHTPFRIKSNPKRANHW